jgi:hypothetical protein
MKKEKFIFSCEQGHTLPGDQFMDVIFNIAWNIFHTGNMAFVYELNIITQTITGLSEVFKWS